MLHGKITRINISLSVLFMKYFLLALIVGFHVFNAQMSCLGNAGVVWVLCRE